MAILLIFYTKHASGLNFAVLPAVVIRFAFHMGPVCPVLDASEFDHRDKAVVMNL